MRLYLLAEDGEDRAVKVDRVKRSIKEVEQDPIAQKAILSLEPVPMLSLDLNKGKGLVFEYGEKDEERGDLDLNVNPNKLMAGAINAFNPRQGLNSPYVECWDADES